MSLIVEASDGCSVEQCSGCMKRRRRSCIIKDAFKGRLERPIKSAMDQYFQVEVTLKSYFFKSLYYCHLMTVERLISNCFFFCCIFNWMEF